MEVTTCAILQRLASIPLTYLRHKLELTYSNRYSWHPCGNLLNDPFSYEHANNNSWNTCTCTLTLSGTARQACRPRSMLLFVITGGLYNAACMKLYTYLWQVIPCHCRGNPLNHNLRRTGLPWPWGPVSPRNMAAAVLTYHTYILTKHIHPYIQSPRLAEWHAHRAVHSPA